MPRAAFWDWAFHENTLVDICKVREALLQDRRSPSRQVLRALAMGALHGPRCETEPTYLSNRCPRTFAPKPDHAVRFWKRKRMRPSSVNTRCCEDVCYSFSDTGSDSFFGDVLFKSEMNSLPAAGIPTLPSRTISFALRLRP